MNVNMKPSIYGILEQTMNPEIAEWFDAHFECECVEPDVAVKNMHYFWKTSLLCTTGNYLHNLDDTMSVTEWTIRFRRFVVPMFKNIPKGERPWLKQPA